LLVFHNDIKIHNQYVECNINRHLFSGTKKPPFQEAGEVLSNA